MTTEYIGFRVEKHNPYRRPDKLNPTILGAALFSFKVSSVPARALNLLRLRALLLSEGACFFLLSCGSHKSEVKTSLELGRFVKQNEALQVSAAKDT